MSAPSTLLREASSVRYGVLSVKASNALRSALRRRALTDDQKETLRRAATFLGHISDGARIATTGTFRAGARPSQSIAALDYALGPIDALRSQIDEDIAPFFSRMARAVHHTADNRLANDERQVAKRALFFFETLHNSLLSERQVRRVALGRPRRRLS